MSNLAEDCKMLGYIAIFLGGAACGLVLGQVCDWLEERNRSSDIEWWD
jgi:hypothetical protein